MVQTNVAWRPAWFDRAGRQARIDIPTLKLQYPLEAVVEGRYGIDLRGSGRSLVGRCPFHDDGGRPNLHVYPQSDRFICYRCGVSGDVFDFIEKIEGVGFLEAIARVAGSTPPRVVVGCASSHTSRASRGHATAGPARTGTRLSQVLLGPEERACLAVAVEVYHARLRVEPPALAYVDRRGVGRDTLVRCRLGFARGNELIDALRARGLSLDAARRAGLLTERGRETLAGRVVVPEIRAGDPIWMVGRALPDGASSPRYLGLSGRKPLLGWEAALAAAKRGAWVVVVEGPFDLLVLVHWGIPAVSLVGTYVRPAAIRALTHLGPLYLALDGDVAGAEACIALLVELEARNHKAIPVWMPRLPQHPDAKDVGALGTLPHGRELFLRALEHASVLAAA